ncbi:hypothetical protein [Candidatus Symbiothrix dinenymphae]|uniref:hypothetical protein n=1 Tax=Candidatus Symbiothrix dinenymphae TaxID=467085 RepID=UPI0006E317E0|nr:hypothetical protein [Candidatus Symbiothrix dinenymphae]
MEKEKEYRFERWEDWSHAIADAIDDFFVSFAYSPEILAANDWTFSQFDFFVNVMHGEKEKCIPRDDKAAIAGKNGQISLCSFDKAGTSLRFAVDNQLKDKTFRLIYDDDADWGDEEPVEVPVEELEFVH